MRMLKWLIAAILICVLAVFATPIARFVAITSVLSDYGPVTGSADARKKEGEMALRGFIDQGALRLATTGEMLAWMKELRHPEAMGQQYEMALLLDSSIKQQNAFVVLGPIEFPAGKLRPSGLLWTKVFIVPEGVPVPKGDLGSNQIWLTAPHKCIGSGCPSDG